MSEIVAPVQSTPPRSLRRSGIRLTLIALKCYFLLLLIMMFFENYLVYHPVPAQELWVEPKSLQVEDVWLPTDYGKVHAWWALRRGDTPSNGAVLICHGNGGNLSFLGDFYAGWQRELHLDVLAFDYPGFGKSEGRPTEASCYAAATAAFDWLIEQQGIPDKRIVLYGQSLGGGVALDLAVRRHCRCLVLDRTFTSLPEVAQSHYPWLPVHWCMRNRFNNMAKIVWFKAPVFFAHGDVDTLIPVTHSERLFAAVTAPKQLLRCTGDNHNDPLPAVFFPTLRDFLTVAETTTTAKN